MNKIHDYNSQESEDDDTRQVEEEIKEITELQEIQQEIPWNQYIPVKSVLIEKEIKGDIDEFQLKSIQKLAVLRSKGLRFNDQLVATKAFKNPCIMDKMLDYHNINTHGSFIVTDYSFQDVYNNSQEVDDQSKSDDKNRTIQFVKSSHKSNYYDKRRRI